MKWLALVLVLAGVTAFVLLREPDGGKRYEPDRAPASRDEQGPATPEPAPSTRSFGELLAGKPGADTQRAAAAFRRLLRTDPGARRAAEERLLDPSTPRDLRMALAFVLGTLPGSDPVLREALARFRGDLEVARCLVFALGATREPIDDDDVFGLGDRPWGVHGPGGLGITVRRFVQDEETRAALQDCLSDGRVGLREAAAISLRHSTLDAGVRSGFVMALRGEAEDKVALVLGEALAGWAGGAPAGAERSQVVATILSRAGDDGLDGYRFRMEDDFGRITLDESSVATLVEYAQPAHSYAVRSFALSALASGAPEDSRPLLERSATEESEAAVRDMATRLLGTLPVRPATLTLLARISREDEAWNVRYQAVDALARFKDQKTAADALKAAAADSDARVAKRAREALD
ncbi:MAG: HEAT repeat domain-containing protein [Planctomycetota bacterium]|jgi:HEAT repeat protein